MVRAFDALHEHFKGQPQGYLRHSWLFLAKLLWFNGNTPSTPFLLKAALNFLFGLETLRSSFPELEHFSLVLRELHDEEGLALVLHTRNLVSRLCGLRLRDIKHRYVCLSPYTQAMNGWVEKHLMPDCEDLSTQFDAATAGSLQGCLPFRFVCCKGLVLCVVPSLRLILWSYKLKRFGGSFVMDVTAVPTRHFPR